MSLPTLDPFVIARSITTALMERPESAARTSEESVTWVLEHPELVGEDPWPWMAAKAVELGIFAPDGPGGDPRRAQLASFMREQPIGGRVAIALHHLAGLDLATTAACTRRTVPEIEQLVSPYARRAGQFAGAGAPAAPVPAPASDAPAPPADAVASGATPPLAGTPTVVAREERTAPGIGWVRALIVPVGVVAILLLIIFTMTYNGAERPSFATTQASAATSKCGVGSPASTRSLEVGASRRPARLALPTRGDRPPPLIVYLGDDGQTDGDAATTAGLEAPANAAGSAVLTLDGALQPWNFTQSAGDADDTAYAVAAIVAAGGSGCVDTERVVLVGYGSGALMATAVVCSGRTSIRGVALVRGAMTPADCRARQPLSVQLSLDANGTTIPADAPNYEAVVASTFDGWAGLAGCGPAGAGAPAGADTVHSQRDGCPTGVSVVLDNSTGAGHAWPSGEATSVVSMTGNLFS